MRGMRRVCSAAGAAALAIGLAAPARADRIVGQPVDGAIGLQPGYSALKHEAVFFHDVILMPVIALVVLLVLALLLICIVRFNRRANPTPAKWSHNTALEVSWTVGTVLVLMFISIFSFRLLFDYNTMPKPDLTVKATGYQWYWGYAYPDQKIGEYASNMLSESEARARGEPYLLAVDNPLVAPVGKTVKVLVTGADVIHGFALPAFGLKIDAVPGKVNETWFRAEKPGLYYGQCDQLCGVNHAFMPIEIKVVSQKDFDAWVTSRRGTQAGGAGADRLKDSTP